MGSLFKWGAEKVKSRLNPKSPNFPSDLTRVGRFLYAFSAAWIAGVWYTGYVNQRVEPGSGPRLVLPGTKSAQYPPDRPGKSPPWAGGGSGNSSNGSSGSSTTDPSGLTSPAGDTNPFPYGWQPNRLDQGWDGTFKRQAVAPFAGTIVVSTPSDPGWRGGGYIAIRKKGAPNTVVYFAEGIQPLVGQGKDVRAGDAIGVPVSNPYNGIVGNIEWGPANPNAPTQPLAQVVTNRVAVVKQFYAWAQSLGLGNATQVSNAGSP